MKQIWDNHKVPIGIVLIVIISTIGFVMFQRGREEESRFKADVFDSCSKIADTLQELEACYRVRVEVGDRYDAK